MSCEAIDTIFHTAGSMHVMICTKRKNMFTVKLKTGWLYGVEE
jgi:hypothetical protein